MSLFDHNFFFCSCLCRVCCLYTHYVRVCVENRHISTRFCEVTMLWLQPKIGCWIVRWLLPLDKIQTSKEKLNLCFFLSLACLFALHHQVYNRRKQKKNYQHNQQTYRVQRKVRTRKKKSEKEFCCWTTVVVFFCGYSFAVCHYHHTPIKYQTKQRSTGATVIIIDPKAKHYHLEAY